jgi:hypothetical protein
MRKGLILPLWVENMGMRILSGPLGSWEKLNLQSPGHRDLQQPLDASLKGNQILTEWRLERASN